MSSAYRLILTDNHVRTREMLTLGRPVGSRNLNFLVLNQGHGGIGMFDGWDANALLTDLVAPMLASGISANVIVLDFCVSASLLPVLAPLCAPGGIVVSSLYSVSDIIVTSDFWGSIKPLLDTGNVGALKKQLIRRMERVSAGITGLSHLEEVRGWSEGQTHQHISAAPSDRDPISIIRYLPDMASALSDTATPAELFRRLHAVKVKPCLGFAEQEILANLPASAAALTPQVRTTIEKQFSDRLINILTLEKYQLKKSVAGLPTFGGDQSLWGQIRDSKYQILALAAGLPRCPTPYSIWHQSQRSLWLDASLAQKSMASPVSSLISIVDPEAPADVKKILCKLEGTQAVPLLERVAGFLQ